MNLRTHARGQGYTDVDFRIPELIQGIENLLYGLEAFHEDGPWDHGDDTGG